MRAYKRIGNNFNYNILIFFKNPLDLFGFFQCLDKLHLNPPAAIMKTSNSTKSGWTRIGDI